MNARTEVASHATLIAQASNVLLAPSGLTLDQLSGVMRDASICGLGQAAPNPVDCVVRYFPHELGKQGA